MFIYRLGKEFSLLRSQHSEWREGQCYFNALLKVEPEIAEVVRGSKYDPFFNDRRIEEFLIYMASWEK